MPIRIPVTFTPAGVTAWAAEESTVLEAARAAGVVILAPCAGRGVCGKCGVFVERGSLHPPDDQERAALKLAPAGVRLACRARVTSEPVTVRPVVSHAPPSDARGETGVDEACVAAVDLGTTTVAAVIVGTRTGRELGRASVRNAQELFGADVLSRIQAAGDGHAEALRSAAERSMIEALEVACGRAGTCLGRIERLVVAGNTAMSALLAGVDVHALGTHPFKLPEGEIAYPADGATRKRLSDAAEVLLVPPIASFVGGDVVAGLLQAGLAEGWNGAVYIDLGTNAEIAFGTQDEILVASAAAGPAFEGAGIAFGGPAVPGALQRVDYDGSDLTLSVIGGGDGRWICGSGLVSTIATLARTGHLADDGALVPDGPLADRFERRDGVLGVRLQDGGPYVMQTDVRAFQSAKAAVAAAVLALARISKAKPRRITRVVVAGEFGSALDARDLIDLGVLPSEMAEVIESAGNASLAGAASLAFDRTALDHIGHIVAACRHVSLAENGTFKESFVPATAVARWSLRHGFRR